VYDRWVRLALLVVCASGCGRIGFDPSDGGRTSDPPPLPDALVCAAQHVEITVLPVDADSDLAIRSDGDTYLALWAAPGSFVRAVLFDSTTVAATPSILPTGPVNGVAGLFRTQTTTLFATPTANGNLLWSSPSPDTASMFGGDARTVARDPIVTDSTGSLRAWVRGDASGLVTSYLDVDGNPGTDRIIQRSAVKAIAAADNSDHTHLSWVEDFGGAQACFQADLDLVPGAPDLGSGDMIATDCQNLRIDSGPGPADAILTVWETSLGVIGIRYLGATVDLGIEISQSGRAPKVRFDGTRFWVVWIEEPANVLRIAAVEQDLSFELVDLPGFVVSGDEAFELVRTGTTVHLAVLGPSTLTLLRTCK
jgi:hypothetical protein